ncbi:MAG TPA: NADH-quinone oxidoreductase subunit C, partial [Candidatus Sulfotelmatobacter sp.]|nr:NADH-quinone oxidoreductase subunit C [Candidatus Sulfotelmatobacter sp.]
MNIKEELRDKYRIAPLTVNERLKDETYLTVKHEDFIPACLALHKLCHSPVLLMFAEDKRRTRSCYRLNTAFYAAAERHWFYVCLDFPGTDREFPSLAKEIYSASLFEREIWEMFGIRPDGSPDLRRARLHEEVWPEGYFPLRKDFQPPAATAATGRSYDFIRGTGEGLFEIPVGPVHAGIIGPGHFHFSVAGEPIINLEIRLGFTHRGVEKIMEGKSLNEALLLSERVAGDAAFAHSLAFCSAAEKIFGLTVPARAVLVRAVCLELERLYNHANDIGGIALDVGFTFAAAFAAVMKETILRLNETLSGSRYLKGVNIIGGVSRDIAERSAAALMPQLQSLVADLKELEELLFGSASFMDRVDATGILRQKTAEDIGVTGLAARASGLPRDLRAGLEPYRSAGFQPVVLGTGDTLCRLKIRLLEFRQSAELIADFLGRLVPGEISAGPAGLKEDFALGAIEGWRGPVLYWLKLDDHRNIERCKIVDPSFHNW